MTKIELASKTDSEIVSAIFEFRKEQFKLRMQRATGQLVQSHLIGSCRKDIARMKTALNARRGGQS